MLKKDEVIAMWFMFLAIISTLLLFWQRVSFPIQEPGKTGTYSIIIPARNEEENLRRLLPSILATKSNQREVIVVDDHSEDRTREAAESFGVKVISNPPLPEEWMGKSWACYNGAKIAKGKTLFFLDADTWFSKHGPERIIQFAENRGLNALVTVHPYHYMHSFWEKFSSIFHLVVFASSGITTIVKDQISKHGGFGPCLIIPAETYWELDGHQSIRSEIVEHLAFARHAEARDVQTYAFSGRHVVNMRMYEASLKAVVEGWSKSFASGAKTASPLMTAAAILWITAVISYLLNIPDMGWWSLIGYGILAFWLARTLREMGNFKWYDAILFPLHFLFFVVLFGYSIMKTFFWKESTWKGRNIAGKNKRGSS
ncbi:glycosyltransferase [Halobacillus sp.]|uniref:glycosyltransferase n=2 Tax=Halobacillus sp. TaxID=56800 RepID=UPI003BB111E3